MLRSLALAASLLALSACGGSEAEEPTLDTGDVVSAATASSSAEAQGQDAPAPEPVPAPEGTLSNQDMALGSEDAPLTVVEYASVTCPGCAGFHQSYFPLIKQELIETGQVRFVFREFPTNPAELSFAGSILARCAANDAGAPAYFAMVDALFKRQREWAYGTDPAGTLEEIFSQVGFDREQIETCLRRTDILETVKANTALGQEQGVDRTPTLLIDGERFDISGSPEEFVAALRAEAEKRR